MSDFFCTDAKDMCYEELAERVRHYKETTEGANGMCDIFDEIRNEAAEEAKFDQSCEIANNLIKEGTLSIEKIAECSGLSVDKVRELAGNKSA